MPVRKWVARYCNSCGRKTEQFQKILSFPNAKHWCVSCAYAYVEYEKLGKRSRFKASNYCIICGHLLPGRQYRFCDKCMPYTPTLYLGDQVEWIERLKKKSLVAQESGDFKNKHFCNACGAKNDRFKDVEDKSIDEPDEIARDRKVTFNTLCSACHWKAKKKWDAWIEQKMPDLAGNEKNNFIRHSVNVEMVNFRNYFVNHYCIKCGNELQAEEKSVREERHSEPKLSRICSACKLYDFIPGWDPIDKYLTLYHDKTKAKRAQALLLYADSRQITTQYSCPHVGRKRYNYNCDIDVPYTVMRICKSCNLRLRHQIRQKLKDIDRSVSLPSDSNGGDDVNS